MFAEPPTDAELLEQQARSAWASIARRHSWTLWVRLSTATPVSLATMEKLVDASATQFRKDIPGSAILVGIHGDTDRLHSHALIFIPRRFSNPFHPAGISVVGSSYEPWLALWWPHGQVWAREYDPDRFQSSSPHGAAEYLARDPGSVWQFGTAPLRKN